MTEKEPVRDNTASKESLIMLINSELNGEFKELLLEIFQTIELIKKEVENIRPQNTAINTYLSSQEVCAMLGISKRCLQYWRDQQKIPYRKLMGKIVYERAEIQAWMKMDRS